MDDMTAYTEQQQLTIARAIAYRLGHPWAVESMEPRQGHYHPRRKTPCPTCGPRPITTLADARKQWAASGGDPERGPALNWSGDGDSIAWSVGTDGTTNVRIEAMQWTRGWPLTLHGRGTRYIMPEHHRLLADIIDAVEGALPAGEEVTRG